MAKIITKTSAGSSFGNIKGGTMKRFTVWSDVLQAEKTFIAYFPLDYDNEPARRYPAMYFFHAAGSSDETWARIMQLQSAADDSVRSGMALPMIIIVPDASGSDERKLGKRLGYFTVPGWDYERYFHTELIPLVDAELRTIADKRHRVIAGASMGGEAAVAYAQKYPEFYGAAAALCGIVGKPEQSTLTSTDKDYAQSLIANNPSLFVKNATPAQVEALKSIRWYADCGDNDFFIEGNFEFVLNMRSRGIPIQFRMRSGVHGFYYWITGLAPIFRFFSNGFA